jgi:hypothetical protein
VIIGLSGYARSGKDTVANNLVEKRGFTKLALADSLKELAIRVNPWIHVPETFSNEQLSNLVDRMGWDWAKSVPEVRRFLQALGTEVRNVLGEDTWIEALKRKIYQLPEGSNVVIPDVRFQNEANWLYYTGNQVWNIARPGVGPVNDHVSEVDMKHWNKFDWSIWNSGTVEELQESVLACYDDSFTL